jgi:23S rRNA (cytidine1920-2'-O)/16S rRNA (cytidine1409-2'-O)-methyltransferase
MEQTNIRHVHPGDIGGTFPVIVVDVSFISLRTIAGHLAEMAEHGGDLIALVKPQFEVGRQNLGRGGIVRDGATRARAVAAALESLSRAGFGALGIIRSPIEGGDGNVEYLAWLRKGDRGMLLEIPA